MRPIAHLGFVFIALIVGCGGDSGSAAIDGAVATNPGFTIPMSSTKANHKVDGVWVELGDADWTCHGSPPNDLPSTHEITLTGRINDFTTGDGIGSATVTAFSGIDLAGNLGTATTNATGDFSLNVAALPSGISRYGFKLEAAAYVKTYLLNQYIDPGPTTAMRAIRAIAESTASSLPSLLGERRDITKGVVAGAMRDCDGNEVSNAVATVSSTAGQANHLEGAKTFYFSAEGRSFPVRTNVKQVMNKDGLFVVLDLPPQEAPAYIQIWGFRSPAEVAAGTLTLLSELPAPVEADAVITASVEVKRQ